MAGRIEGSSNSDHTEQTAVETRTVAIEASGIKKRAQATAPAQDHANENAHYRLVADVAAQNSTNASTALPYPDGSPMTPRQTRHVPRPAIGVLLLIIVGIGTWWLTPTDWAPPWVQPPGPLTASGTLEADEVLVGAEVSGRIIELVQEGQAVQADEVVARLDDTLIQIQIRQANVAALQQLQIQADRYRLRSPISGIVTRVPMHTGEVVAPGQTVVAVSDLSNLDLTAYVLERDLGQVRVGQQVTVTADPFPGRGFLGVVTSTNPRAEFTPRNVQTREDRLNLVFGVNIRVENPDGALKPGMPADVTFPSLP